MTNNYWTKDKKNTLSSAGKGKVILKKKRINWNQSLKTAKSADSLNKNKRIKKSLQYLLLLKKFNNVVDYKNVKLLKAFLTKYGKIRPRRKTRISIQYQRKVAKSIRKARAFGLIPFTCDVKT
jgi:small subunit ribosomal protein S18